MPSHWARHSHTEQAAPGVWREIFQTLTGWGDRRLEDVSFALRVNRSRFPHFCAAVSTTPANPTVRCLHTSHCTMQSLPHCTTTWLVTPCERLLARSQLDLPSASTTGRVWGTITPTKRERAHNGYDSVRKGCRSLSRGLGSDKSELDSGKLSKNGCRSEIALLWNNRTRTCI